MKLVKWEANLLYFAELFLKKSTLTNDLAISMFEFEIAHFSTTHLVWIAMIKSLHNMPLKILQNILPARSSSRKFILGRMQNIPSSLFMFLRKHGDDVYEILSV